MCLSITKGRDVVFEYSECSSSKYLLCESNASIATHCETIIPEPDTTDPTITDISRSSTILSGMGCRVKFSIYYFIPKR